MKLLVFFVIMVTLCVAGSLYNAFEKMGKLKRIEVKNHRASLRKIKDIVSE